MFEIHNEGQRIVKTNYWESEHARSGYFFLSWNAGAARLLIPDSQKAMLREVKKAREVIISRGRWPQAGNAEALELMFEDDTDSPFVIHLVAEQCDRLIPPKDQGSGIDVALWTKGGLKQRLPGRYRVVESLPCMDPWTSH